MSSLLTTPGQTPARVKFLRVVDTTQVRYPLETAKSVMAMMTLAQFEDATSPGSSDPSGALLKDMGKEVVVYDAEKFTHKAVYRLVQPVSGVDVEGDGGSAVGIDFTATPSFYVKVWDEAGAGVNVARVG